MDWIEQSLTPYPTQYRSFRRRSSQPIKNLTVTVKETISKKLNINHKNTHTCHTNTIQVKGNKQLNIQQKQNYPDSVASCDTQPGNEVGLFYNGPEHHSPHTRACHWRKCREKLLQYQASGYWLGQLTTFSENV